MIFECPGSQRFKQPHPKIIKCGYCSAEVEIWTDELQATCHNCKKIVHREKEQNCMDWCRYARDCCRFV